MLKDFLKLFGLISFALFFSFSCFDSTKEKTAVLKDISISSNDGEMLSIEELMKKRGLVGLSVAIFEDYEIKEIQVWGEKEVGTNELIDENTVFSTASISKAITATLIVKLAYEGKIDLDVPVNTYLKRWKLQDNEFTKNNPVTLRHLLLHTAGTTQGGFADYYAGDEVPSVIESLNGEIQNYDEPVKIVFEPGSKMQYSGGGYTVAMVALEDHIGRSLRALAKEYLFDPIGMNNSTFLQPNEPGFFMNAAKSHNEEREVYGLPICPQLSASGLWSNPTDMSLFLIEIQKGLKGNSKVFAKEMVKEMLEPAAFSMGFLDRSLGWEVQGYGNIEWFAHGGANTGTGGHIYATKERGRGIVIFGNGPNGIRLPILDEVRSAIIDAHDWSINLEDKYEISKNYRLDKIFEGRYFAEPGALSLIQRDGKIVLSPGENGPAVFELFHIGGNKFALDGMSFQFEIFTDSKTKETYIGVTGNGRKSPTKDFLKVSDSPKSPYEFFEANSFEESLNYFKNQKELDVVIPETLEENLYKQGDKYLSQEDAQKAIDLFEIMVALYPNSANAYDSLGEAYLAEGNKQKAKENYKKTLKLNPENDKVRKIINEFK